jgi:hypothetical protein
MIPNRIVDSSTKRGVVTGVSGIGLVLALIVIGYGIAKPPELSSQSSGAAGVAAPSATISSPAPNAGALAWASAAGAFGAMPFDRTTVGIDGARECAPKAGITNACIFN